MTEQIKYELQERRINRREPQSIATEVGGAILPFFLFGGVMPHGGENLATLGSNVDPTAYAHTLEALGVTNNIAGRPER